MNSPEVFTPPGAHLSFYADFIFPEYAKRLQETLRREITWRQDRIFLFGKSHLIPRRQAFQGETGLHYQYSNLQLAAEPWHPDVKSLRDQLVPLCHVPFNSVLLNQYRTGGDKMGWHSDDEPELGKNPVIASITLGATRRFVLKHRYDKSQPKLTFDLPCGSLLIMAGQTQHYWQHALPETRRIHEERINLTFRYIIPKDTSI